MRPHHPLIGRRSDRERLATFVDTLAGGTGAFVLVEGEAGIGKSAVLAEVVERALDRGMTAFIGETQELEFARPFGPLVRALKLTEDSTDDERAMIARLIHGDHDVRFGEGLRFRIVEKIITLIERSARDGPVLLVLEDLHWADTSSLIVLQNLARDAAQSPIGLLGTTRPVPPGHPLHRIADTATAHIVLDGLPDHDVAELAASATGAAPGPRLTELIAGANGNPLLVLEMLRALEAEQAIQVTRGVAEISHSNVPERFTQTVLRRLRVLPDDTVTTLQIAAALGVTFDLGDLSTTLRRPVTELLSVLQPAMIAGFVHEADPAFAFRHDLVRGAIYDSLPKAARAAVHLQAARNLAAARADPDRVAEHFALAAPRGDKEAIEWLAAAGRRAMGRSAVTAAQLLQHALSLMYPDDLRREPATRDLALALMWSGRLADAESLIREMGSPDAGLYTVLCGSLFLQASWQAARAAAEEGLAHANEGSHARATLLGQDAFTNFACGLLDRAEQSGTEAVAAAGSLGFGFAAALGNAALAWVAQERGQMHEAIAFGDAALAAERRDASARPFSPAYHRAAQLEAAERYGEAIDGFHRGRREAEEAGAEYAQAIYHGFLALAHFNAGFWDDALLEARTSIELGEETRSRSAEAYGRTVVLRIALHGNRLEEAMAMLAELRGFFQQFGRDQFGITEALIGEALVVEAQGEPGEALALLEREWDRRVDQQAAYRLLQLAPPIIRLASPRTEDFVSHTEKAAALVNTPSASAVALRCRGLATHDPEALSEAAIRYAATREPEAAFTAEEAGVAWMRAGDRERGVAVLLDAAGRYERLGASRDAARVEAVLRAAGVGRGGRRSGRRPTTGWESLTPSELAVVELAAGGLTNPEIGERLFISRRTAQRHLSNIFLKLGVTSRAQLAAEATRRGL